MGIGKLALAGLATTVVVLALAAPAATAETALCATGTPESALCGEGASKKLSGATIKATASNPQLTTSIVNVSCEDSAITIEPASSTSEAAISTEVTALSFSGSCKTTGGTACTFTILNLPYPASIEAGGSGKSSLTIADPSGAGFKVVCGVLINCTFTTKEATLAGTNGSPTTFSVSKLNLERSGGFCPETSTLDASYAVSEPSGFTVL